MSVIGIDFGNDNCYIAVARQGGIETIANDYSLRSTPSVVAFGEKSRVLGVAAKSQRNTNFKNTIVDFKRLIGKQYGDPRVKSDLNALPYKVVEQKDGSIGICVNYAGEQRTFSPTQITAMLFTKLKHTAETALGIKVVDVVIGIPCFCDDLSRHAMLEAAAAAGLNVLRLLNETTAVALAYGIYKQDLPAPEEKPRNVIFVDCGHASLQVSAVAFNKGKLKMLTTASEEHLGGRDFDALIADHFCQEFKSTYKLNAGSSQRAWLRLITEVEKLKKQMSANATVLPLNIECFMDDKDVSGRMKRADMEEFSNSLIQRVANTLHLCLLESGLEVSDIFSVEIVGGSTRIPAIKSTIERVYKKTPSTTLNADEAVARGCALMCAILSPTFKVREFSVTDVQPYSIKLVWLDENGQESDMEVFPRNHQFPFSKMLTFHRKAPIELEAHYSAPKPTPDSLIGQFRVLDVVPSADGENQRVKVKVRVNPNGIFTVASASMAEKKDVVEEEQQEAPQENNGPTNGDQEPPKENVQPTDNTEESKGMETDKPENTKDANLPAEPQQEKKKKMKTVDLRIDVAKKVLSPKDLDAIIEQEAQMVQSDKLENERINAKNSVEEYVYEMRDKICDVYESFISDQEKSVFSEVLNNTENWLYEDGEDCAKQVYVDKLSELKKYGEPVRMRAKEREELPLAFDALLVSMQRVRKVAEEFRSGNEQYNHLDPAEIEKVEKAMIEKEQFVNKNLGSISALPKHKDCPITVSQVYSERNSFESLTTPIITKPKPKPKVEEKPELPAQEEKSSENSDKNKTDEQMDVD